MRLDEIDPLAPTTVECPYPFYEALRDAAPVYRVPDRNWFLVSTFDIAVEVLKNPEEFSSQSGVGVPAGPDGQHPPVGNRTHTLLTADPPVHSHYRTLVNKAFSVRRVAAMEDEMRTLADEMISDFLPRGEVELGEEFAVRLPLVVICDMLGLPRSQLQTFKKWSDGIAQLGGLVDAEQLAEIVRDNAEFTQYLIERVEERRREPSRRHHERPDHVDVHGPGRRAAAVAHGRDRQHPSPVARRRQRDHHQDDHLRDATAAGAPGPDAGRARRSFAGAEPGGGGAPTRVSGAVPLPSRDPATRCWPGWTSRRAPAWGCSTPLRIATAASTTTPPAFDVRRSNARSHLAFSQGIHFCVGAPLARLEAKVAFEALLDRLDNIAFAPGKNDFRHVPSFTHRGLKQLWLTFDAR